MLCFTLDSRVRGNDVMVCGNDGGGVGILPIFTHPSHPSSQAWGISHADWETSGVSGQSALPLLLLSGLTIR